MSISEVVSFPTHYIDFYLNNVHRRIRLYHESYTLVYSSRRNVGVMASGSD